MSAYTPSPSYARSEEAGLSLIEIVVAAAIACIFGGLLAGILIAGMTSTEETANRDRAAGTVQAISTSLSSSIRNASWVTAHQSVDGNGNDLVVVRARVADGDVNWVCRAWAIGDLGTWTGSSWDSAPDGREEFWVTTYDVDTAMPAPDTSWGALARHVRQIERDETPAPTPPNMEPYFVSIDDEQLSWQLGVVTRRDNGIGDEQAIRVSGAAIARAYDQGTGTC